MSHLNKQTVFTPIEKNSKNLGIPKTYKKEGDILCFTLMTTGTYSIFAQS